MVLTPTFGLIAVVAIGFCTPLVMRALAHATAPARRQMLVLGEALLASPDLDPKRREVVAFMLGQGFDARFMPFICVALPMRVFAWMRRVREQPLPEISDTGLRHQFEVFLAYRIRASLAANPLFSVLATFEFALLILISFPAGMTRRATEVCFSATLDIEAWGH